MLWKIVFKLERSVVIGFQKHLIYDVIYAELGILYVQKNKIKHIWIRL